MNQALTEPQQKALAQLQKLYAKVPNFECKPNCSDCCGPHLQAEVEWLNISLWLQQHNKQEPAINHLNCPYLNHHQCSIYEVRPMQCRLFGAVKNLRCPHGYLPATLLTVMKAQNLLSDVIFLLPPKSHGTGEG